MVCFAEALEVDDFPLAQELNHIVHIRIVTQPQNIVRAAIRSPLQAILAAL